MNLLVRRHVRGGDRVIAKLCYSEGPCHLIVANANDEDIVARVDLLRCGYRCEVMSKSLSVEAALEDLGVADRAVRAIGIVHAMQCKGYGVKIAFGHDAGGIDELLVLRASVYGRTIEVCRSAERLKVGVDDGVGFGQQPRSFWRSGLAQNQRDNQRRH